MRAENFVIAVGGRPRFPKEVSFWSDEVAVKSIAFYIQYNYYIHLVIITQVILENCAFWLE